MAREMSDATTLYRVRVSRPGLTPWDGKPYEDRFLGPFISTSPARSAATRDQRYGYRLDPDTTYTIESASTAWIAIDEPIKPPKGN